jgi:hypothetical protein
MAVQTLKITRTIVGINPIGNNTWQIEFNPNQTIITQQEVTTPVIYYSSSALPVILNPFLNNVGNWNTNDYNATINNTDIGRANSYYQKIDYATNQTIPINFDQIIAGTATRASIPNSNFTSYQFSGLRYWGSKNTTDNFNTASISQSNVVQGIQNSNIGSTTLGYPSVNNWDASILEFNWGGGTYPEIYGGGALSLNQLLNVGSDKDKVTKFSSTEDGFTGSVELEFFINSKPVFNQYTTTATTTTNARISTIGVTVPLVSDYMIASANPSTTATIVGGTNYIVFNNNINEVTTNSSGYYTTGSLVTNENLFNKIAVELGQGERWFVTMYNTLPYTVQGVLSPYNFNYGAYTIDEGYNYPLAAKGVFEIDSLSSSPILPTSSFQAKFGTGASSGQIGIGSVLSSGSAANSITYFNVSVTDYDGNNRASILAALSAGQTLTIENMDTSYPFSPSFVYEGPFVYTITGTPTPFGSYYRIPVTFVSATNGTNIRLTDGVGDFFFYQIYTDGNSNLYFNLPGDGNFSSNADFGNGDKGLLIWKSQQGSYMLFNDATLGGVGKGGLLTSNPNPTIQQDFTYITQTYGNNPKNQ